MPALEKFFNVIDALDENFIQPITGNFFGDQTVAKYVEAKKVQNGLKTAGEQFNFAQTFQASIISNFEATATPDQKNQAFIALDPDGLTQSQRINADKVNRVQMDTARSVGLPG